MKLIDESTRGPLALDALGRNDTYELLTSGHQISEVKAN